MLSKPPVGLMLVCGAMAASAQEFDIEEPPRYFIRTGGRALFNVRAEVKESPMAADRPGFFDNGFVLRDIGGAGPTDKTWNWGYDDNSQVVGGQILMQRLRDLPQPESFSGKDDPALGGEIVAGAELFRFEVGQRELRLGVELGYGYNDFSVSDSASVRGASRLSVFPFDLDGVVPPRAPYSGTFEGPGPLIDLFPAGTNVFTSSSRGDFAREIESHLHLFKLGVWLEYPLTTRFNLAMSVGYASLYADTRYRFSEQFTFDNPAVPDISRTTHTIGGREWLPGMYAQFRAQYQFFRHIGAYIGGDFQYNGKLEFEGEGRTITLDFNSQLAATAGLIFSF